MGEEAEWSCREKCQELFKIKAHTELMLLHPHAKKISPDHSEKGIVVKSMQSL